jgi:hypothetical protein
MATKTEALRLPNITTESSTPIRRRRIAKAIGDWFRKGQLGAPSTAEISRYTGARV